MTLDRTLLEAFEAKGRALLGASSVAGFWRIDRQAENVKFPIGAGSAAGFAIGATCETYGLYRRRA